MENHYSIRSEVTMTAAEANYRALIFVIPIILLFGIPYYVIWMRNLTLENLIIFFSHNRSLLNMSLLLAIPVFATGILLHELIHGLVFLIFCKKGIHSIEFGVMWKYLAPYCHCKEPIRARPYIMGALMPALVLGFLPALAGIITGSFLLLLFGIIFSVASGGDFLIVWLLRFQPKNILVLDHESKIGCYLLEIKEGNHTKEQ
jgi:hypothetical protein